MTLIEILMVVWILAILVGISVPRFSWSKEKSRDVLRISQINEIWAAIASYWIDHGWYPESTGTCISSLTELVDEWYLSKIDPDPNNEKIWTYCDSTNEDDNICPKGYYNYISNWSWFVLAAYMEESKNWNYVCLNEAEACHDKTTNRDHLCQDLKELWTDKDLSKFISSNRLNDSLKSHIYVYLHQ